MRQKSGRPRDQLSVTPAKEARKRIGSKVGLPGQYGIPGQFKLRGNAS